jgi:DNA-directed RNA polymerase specialized sigma24 family protein
MRPQDVSLVDEFGRPFDDRLHDALITLGPRLQRDFPVLADACVLTDILEETGKRLAAREARRGPLEELHSYAWVVAKRVAALRATIDQWAARTVPLDGPVDAGGLASNGFGTAEEIEDTILAKQLAARLPDAQRRVYAWKYMGLSTEEIAVREGTSTVNIESCWRQVKRRLRRFVRRPRRPATTGA